MLESRRRALPKASGDYCPFPLNLSVFMEIGDPAFSFTTGTELMQRLLDKKTRDLRTGRDVRWNVLDPLSAMAKWMSDRQKLSCPDSVLNNFDGAKDWLSSVGLIVVEQDQLAFFHESVFDFLFAQTFSLSDRDIADFLTSTEQHLFRRTQVRQILNSMRDIDELRYLEVLETVLTHPKIRTHIKHAVAQWLASLDSATQDELKVIQQLDDNGEEFPVLMAESAFRIGILVRSSERRRPTAQHTRYCVRTAPTGPVVVVKPHRRQTPRTDRRTLEKLVEARPHADRSSYRMVWLRTPDARG